MITQRIAIAVLSLAMCAGVCQAVDYWIQFLDSSDDPIGATHFFDGGSTPDDASVAVPSNAATVRISAGSAANAGHITLTGTGPASPNILSIVVSHSFWPSIPTTNPNGIIGNLDGITISNAGLRSRTRLYGGISGNLTGPIWVGQLYRFDAGGGITSPITAESSGDGGLCIIEAGYIQMSGSQTITILDGDIMRVRTQGGIHSNIELDNGSITEGVFIDNGGDLWASVRAYNGYIEEVAVTGTIHGSASVVARSLEENPTPANPNYRVKRVIAEGSIGAYGGGSLFPVTILSEGDIELIVGDLVAIEVDATDNNGKGDIYRLEARDNDLSGTVRAVDLGRGGSAPGVYVGGDVRDLEITLEGGSGTGDALVGDMVIDGDFDASSFIEPASGSVDIGLAADATIEIAGGFAGDLSFSDDPGLGLQGQIIIREANGSGSWTGDITVGSTTLSPKPHYTQSKDAIGGGSVGVVPFHFHAVDCAPAHTSVDCEWDGTITMEFYGPITAEHTDDYELDGFPVVVERVRTDLAVSCPSELNPECDPCEDLSNTWVDVTSDFDFFLHPDGNVRQLELVRKTAPPSSSCGGSQYLAHRYRVRPVDKRTMSSPDYGADNELRCATTGTPLVFMPDYDDVHWQCPDDNDFYYFTVSYRTGTLDLNQSGWVDALDLGEWIADPADLNDDGTADSEDSGLIIEHQGAPGS